MIPFLLYGEDFFDVYCFLGGFILPRKKNHLTLHCAHAACNESIKDDSTGLGRAFYIEGRLHDLCS